MAKKRQSINHHVIGGVKPQGVKPQGVKPQGVKPQGVKPQGVKPLSHKARLLSSNGKVLVGRYGGKRKQVVSYGDIKIVIPIGVKLTRKQVDRFLREYNGRKKGVWPPFSPKGTMINEDYEEEEK